MEDSTQKIRERIMGQIPETIHKFLGTIDPWTAIRILGDTPNRSLDRTCYLDSVRPIVSKIEESLREHHPDAQTRLLAVDIYPGKHSYFVLDLNNVNYVYETAHKVKAPIPVYVLRLSVKKISIFRRRELDQTIAGRLAEMHNGHGYDPLPLVDDHNQTVGYRYPRSPEFPMWYFAPAAADLHNINDGFDSPKLSYRML